MGIERSLHPVAAVSGVGAAGRGRPFGMEELAGGGGRGDGTLLQGNIFLLPSCRPRAGCTSRERNRGARGCCPNKIPVKHAENRRLRASVGGSVARPGCEPWGGISSRFRAAAGLVPVGSFLQASFFPAPTRLSNRFSDGGTWEHKAQARRRGVRRASCLRGAREAMEMPWAAERRTGWAGTWALLLPSKWR